MIDANVQLKYKLHYLSRFGRLARGCVGWLLFSLLFACQSDTVRRHDFLIQGIDVSRYQAEVNWDTIAAQGMHFAFVKATEGATHADQYFEQNWQALREAGLRRGAYHFYRPRTSPVAQADFFVSKISLVEGDLPPVLDVEVLDGIHPTTLVTNVKTWLRLIERRYGVQPIVYTNLSFYNKHLAGHLEDYPLWIARYGREKPVLACGRDWQFWQYGSRGLLGGIAGYVDFNVFAGGWEDLDRMTYQGEDILSRSLTRANSPRPQTSGAAR
ncbi:MAG: GH25 family lysozyme [Bacteroidota bacterium]